MDGSKEQCRVKKKKVHEHGASRPTVAFYYEILSRTQLQLFFPEKIFRSPASFDILKTSVSKINALCRCNNDSFIHETRIV